MKPYNSLRSFSNCLPIIAGVVGFAGLSLGGDSNDATRPPSKRVGSPNAGFIYQYREPQNLSLALPAVVTVKIVDGKLRHVISSLGGVDVEKLTRDAVGGDAPAQSILAGYYFDGKHGLVSDKVEAYKWAWIAHQAGYKPADHLLTQFELFMTPNQLKAATVAADQPAEK